MAGYREAVSLRVLRACCGAVAALRRRRQLEVQVQLLRATVASLDSRLQTAEARIALVERRDRSTRVARVQLRAGADGSDRS